LPTLENPYLLKEGRVEKVIKECEGVYSSPFHRNLFLPLQGFRKSL